MFNPETRAALPAGTTVAELIEELSKIPGNYSVSVSGSPNGYIHVDDINQSITMDCMPLTNDYPFDAFQ